MLRTARCQLGFLWYYTNMLKQLLKLPLWACIVIVLLVGVVVALLFSSLNPWNPFNYLGRPHPTIDLSRDAVIREIRSLNQLETTSFTIEKVIDAGNDGNIFQDILYGDRLLLIAHGQVRAGVDLSQIRDTDVHVSAGKLTIQLPQTRILSSALDTEKTTVYDRRQGLLSRGDKDLETQARQAAEQSIRQAACDGSILEQAAIDARQQLTHIYALAGFSQVEIRVQPGRCQ